MTACDMTEGTALLSSGLQVTVRVHSALCTLIIPHPSASAIRPRCRLLNRWGEGFWLCLSRVRAHIYRFFYRFFFFFKRIFNRIYFYIYNIIFFYFYFLYQFLFFISISIYFYLFLFFISISIVYISIGLTLSLSLHLLPRNRLAGAVIRCRVIAVPWLPQVAGI